MGRGDEDEILRGNAREEVKRDRRNQLLKIRHLRDRYMETVEDVMLTLEKSRVE